MSAVPHIEFHVAADWDSLLGDTRLDFRRKYAEAICVLASGQHLFTADRVLDKARLELNDPVETFLAAHKGEGPDWWPKRLDRIGIKVVSSTSAHPPVQSILSETHALNPNTTDLGFLAFTKCVKALCNDIETPFFGDFQIRITHFKTGNVLGTFNYNVRVGDTADTAEAQAQMGAQILDRITPPGPIEDNPSEAFNAKLEKRLIADTVDRLQDMIDGIRSGALGPVRGLLMVQTYAATCKTHIREVMDDDNDFEDDDDMDMMMEGPYGMMPRIKKGRLGRRARRARHGQMQGYPMHGGPHEQVRQALGAMEDLTNTVQRAPVEDRTAKMRNLTEAIKNARDIDDVELEAELRLELKAVMRGPVPATKAALAASDHSADFGNAQE